MKNKQINIKILFLFLIISFFLFLLTGCSKKEEDLLTEKLNTQMNYLDSKLASIMNELNGISVSQYKITSQKTNDTKDNKKENEDQSAETNSSESSNDSSGEGVNETIFRMTPNNVLNRDAVINWDNIKMQVESIYSDWTTIILDLYNLNISSEEILAFSTNLNNTIGNTNKEEKIVTLKSLATLYSHIPVLADGYLDEDTVNIFYAKSYVYLAYSYIEEMNQNEIKTNLAKAEEYLLLVVNNIDSSKNQYNVNKSYILLKEFQNAIDLNDIDLLYIKYRNLMQELEII